VVSIIVKDVVDNFQIMLLD